jgi:hypothetical protein
MTPSEPAVAAGPEEPAVGAPRRVVALGASNLTRGLPALMAAAREEWGPEVEVLAALGLGRSYGIPSRILVRTLPGILESGLWRTLEESPGRPTRALITDVGNDILYGSSAAGILAWVEECVERLERFTPDIVLTDLPVPSIRRLTPGRFLFFRSILFPRCRLSHAEVMATAETVVDGLEHLASRRGLQLFRLRPEWYGFDPIHFRPRVWRSAWREILHGPSPAAPRERASLGEALRLYGLFPERQWLLGFERVHTQAGLRLKRGGRIRLY